ncbi:MAG: hypothetical protein ACTSQI_21765 [Candidatus Helarchaeota archaeon]
MKCGKCGIETDRKPLPIRDYKNGGFKKIIRCDDCIKEGLKTVLDSLAKNLKEQPNDRQESED